MMIAKLAIFALAISIIFLYQSKQLEGMYPVDEMLLGVVTRLTGKPEWPRCCSRAKSIPYSIGETMGPLPLRKMTIQVGYWWAGRGS